MPRVIGSVVRYPALSSMASYLGVILLGAVLLHHPAARGESSVEPVSWLDALFTSTSAVCVTGLTVRSTPDDFSPFGQVVILLLIQFGGIGIMTVTTFVRFRFGASESMRSRTLISETLGEYYTKDLRWILRNVMLVTFGVESVGFAVLAARNVLVGDIGTLGESLWHALFHSVSAFCNAGFSLQNDSLEGFRDDLVVNGVVCALVIIGGLGFPVLFDLWRRSGEGWPGVWLRLHVHTKLMLVGTAALLAIGTVTFLILEWDSMVFRNVSTGERWLIAFFHSTNCRTAGFNTVELWRFTNATLFISILLMGIGGGPCSTAGGVKVTTVMVLAARAWSTFKGRTRVDIFERHLPHEAIERAAAALMVFVMVAIVALTWLLAFEQSNLPHIQSEAQFLDAMFEVTSALGTVGLSTGLTPDLSRGGRWIIIVLMFVGRLGSIPIFTALARPENDLPYERPVETPLIG